MCAGSGLPPPPRLASASMAASASTAHGHVIPELPVRTVTSVWSRIWRPLRQPLPDACYASGKALRHPIQPRS